jgi:Domain of unknown function (DUF1942)
VTVADLTCVTAPQFYTTTGTVYSVEVTVTTKAGVLYANPLSFSARSAAGDSYDLALGATTDELVPGDVDAGQRVRGTVSFDVPTGQAIAPATSPQATKSHPP